MKTRPLIQIRTQLEPGDVGYIIYLHGMLYAREYELDHTFEGYVAERLGQFAKQYDPSKDYFAVAEQDGRIVGSIVIDAQDDQTAMLRFFLLHPHARGRGLGHQLMNEALVFCREHAFKQVFLWTITELKAAIHLYKQAGFECTERKTHEVWGALRTEERYDLVL
jgi:N-acetylglutamate synthase-like GNAT family acetyltransferase